MEKKWYKSKAVWGSILLTAAGLFKVAGEYLATGSFDLPGLMAVFGGLSVFGIRDAL